MVAAAGPRREGREPQLLTHDGPGRGGLDDGFHEDSAEQELNEGGIDERRGKRALTPAQRKKRRWKIIRRSLYAFVGIFLVLPALAFVITYFLVDVPSPEEVAAGQAKVVTYYYAGGAEMGKEVPADGGNRVILKPEDITPVVRHAVYAAEDNTFETNSGFDISGIMRAAWNQVTGGVGGGSTITQQYVKKATENDEYSLTRKWTELVQAFKMNNEQSKDEIITAYLNTIYFGRGANGIETAAQAYFGKDVHAKDLTASQAALLAGMIQQPGRADQPEVMKQRWNYVLDQMVSNGWLSKTDRQAAEFPKLIPSEEAKPNTISGPDAYIMYRVKAELEAKGYPEERIQAGGYQVHTTIDGHAQRLAEKSVNEVMEGQPGPKELKRALVAVDPKTGAVRAYYGGPNKAGVDQVDWANSPRNPGSSIKPFDIIPLLQQGKGLGETYDGSSPRKFGDVEIANSENSQCPDPCSIAEAMERSINTVFYDIVVNDIGPKAVKEAAVAAGVPEQHGDKETFRSLNGNISIGGGDNYISPTDMAGSYATFAANGVRHDSHFVSKLTTSDGEVIFDETTPAATQGEPAFADDPERSEQIAGNITMSLEPVVPYSDLSCPDNQDCAGKTGTHQYTDPDDGSKSVNENSQAWMVGYTPHISAAAYVGADRNTIPIRDANGSPIYGSGLPGEIWETFMGYYHEGKPEAQFEEVEPIGKVVSEAPVIDDSAPDPGPTERRGQPPETPPGRDRDRDREPELPSSESPTPTTGQPPGNDDDGGYDIPGFPPGQDEETDSAGNREATADDSG